jgi:hypothetical protein
MLDKELPGIGSLQVKQKAINKQLRVLNACLHRG